MANTVILVLRNKNLLYYAETLTFTMETKLQKRLVQKSSWLWQLWHLHIKAYFLSNPPTIQRCSATEPAIENESITRITENVLRTLLEGSLKVMNKHASSNVNRTFAYVLKTLAQKHYLCIVDGIFFSESLFKCCFYLFQNIHMDI